MYVYDDNTVMVWSTLDCFFVKYKDYIVFQNALGWLLLNSVSAVTRTFVGLGPRLAGGKTG
jgi:hypothetical protein